MDVCLWLNIMWYIVCTYLLDFYCQRLFKISFFWLSFVSFIFPLMDIWPWSESIVFSIVYSFLFPFLKKILIQCSSLMWAGLTLTPQSNWAQISILLPSSWGCKWSSWIGWQSLIHLRCWLRGDAVHFQERKGSCHRPWSQCWPGALCALLVRPALYCPLKPLLYWLENACKVKGEVHAYFIEQVYYSY